MRRDDAGNEVEGDEALGARASTMALVLNTVAADQALICCAVPADPSAGGGDRLILDL